MKDRNKVSDLELMLHADGELEAGESQRMDARLGGQGGGQLDGATDMVGGAWAPAARAKVAAVRELGDLVRGHVELCTDEAEPRLAGLWSELSKRLDLDAEAARVAPAKARPAPGGFGRWLGQWFERYRGHILTGALSAGAVAAVALLLRPGHPEQEIARSGGGAGTKPLAPTFVAAPPEIEALDVPNGTGTVLTMEDEDGAAAIVWVTPEDVEDL